MGRRDVEHKHTHVQPEVVVTARHEILETGTSNVIVGVEINTLWDAMGAQNDALCVQNDAAYKPDDIVRVQNESMCAQNDIVGVRADITGAENGGLLTDKENEIMDMPTDMHSGIMGMPHDIVLMQYGGVSLPGSQIDDEGTYPTKDGGHDNTFDIHSSHRAMDRMRRSRTCKLFTILRAIFHLIPAPPLACKWLAMPAPGRSNYSSSASGRVLTGTLFGQRKGHVQFAVQDDPSRPPLLLLELATPTNTLVKEMASGLVRIALECERTQNRGQLLLEQVWTMYCNGRKTGYAIRRACSEADSQVFRLVRAVSMGAGVLPIREEGPDGELMYMRARFERVVGSRDSEAFYMMNPDGTGGPELSIFLLRI